MGTFDNTAYNPNEIANSNLKDISDSYGNMGFVVSFYHMISSKSLRFKAYITAFNETYSPDFAAEQVFGRADPIYTYKNTNRNISLAFKVPASSTGEAYENLAKAQTLIQMLYPAYTDVNNALTVAQAPLIRLKVMNLTRNASATSPQGAGGSKTELYTSFSSHDDPQKGLLGVIQNVTVQHHIEDEAVGVLEIGNNTILPKLIEINLDFRPIHEHSIGWLGGNEFTEPSFPYGAQEYGNPGAPSDTGPSEGGEDNRATEEEEQAEEDKLLKDAAEAGNKSPFDTTAGSSTGQGIT